ncbi:hypothetical protein JTB14_008191 [Gonioctena quinquepunctata]|nr:hypothetical protein JTB14_008191 [Gonioctena quinquepunctata]
MKWKQFSFTVKNPGIRNEYYTLYDKTPYGFFKIFVKDDIISNFVHQTNVYEEQQLQQKTVFPKSRSKPWTAVDNIELRNIFGNLIWMGLLKAPQLRDKIPYGFFKIFVTDDIVSNIVHQTNVFVEQQLQQKTVTPKSRTKP